MIFFGTGSLNKLLLLFLNRNVSAGRVGAQETSK